MHSAVCFSWLQRWYSSRHRHTSNAALCIKLIALSVAGEELITAAYCIFTMYPLHCGLRSYCFKQLALYL
jgi:hypothetical protein